MTSLRKISEKKRLVFFVSSAASSSSFVAGYYRRAMFKCLSLWRCSINLTKVLGE